PYRTRTLQPSFAVKTSEQTTCSLRYTHNNQEVVQNFPQPFGLQHQITLEEDLPYTEGEETPISTFISCEDEAGNVFTKQFYIIMDWQPPLIGARANDADLILTDFSRTHRSYDQLNTRQRQLSVVADEPVQC